MTDHPYKSMPPKAFWRGSVAGIDSAEIDPVGIFDMRIGKTDRVATAGSCFAQHIARHLAQAGFNYYVSEQAHAILPPDVAVANNYAMFSARYGNIYTARQLLQLIRRAIGEFSPAEGAWINRAGQIVDPFRPSIQPGGFMSAGEMLEHRRQHLEAVRTMFTSLDVFVFTLGLTECWRSKEDGAVFPICPGVEGGEFDNEKYEFYNQTVFDVVSDMSEFLRILKTINPTARTILTVSPVPLAATAVPDEHVLTATTYSKSVLRVAAGMLRDQFSDVDYFPSYEIIINNAVGGKYYAKDLRNVLEPGVSHVMRTFLAHATDGSEHESLLEQPAVSSKPDFSQAMEDIVEVMCDEEKLASFGR